MKGSCLLSSPSPLRRLHPTTHLLTAHAPFLASSYSTFHPWTKLPFKSLCFPRLTLPPLHTVRTQAVVETIPDESECIEIGYIANVHGLKGEVRVKPTTDFPELRFSKPGKRWLKVRVLGKEIIQEVELTNGRGHPGQKSWILSFDGIDTVDKAKQIVGSTLLVRETNRPVLEEGEFYVPDLVGMKVVLKETGKLVGTVVNVFNSGASDLLQVKLKSFEGKHDHSGLLEAETGASSPLVWVPFVEAIVPHVDMAQREIQITPPKGLLELNVRSDGRSKKERRQLEWKQRKKFQQRLIISKKKLTEMGQEHILQGLSFGDKAQKSLLANQIVGINLKLLQQAIQTIDTPYNRCKLTEYIHANSSKLSKSALRISKGHLVHFGSDEKLDSDHEKCERGLHLLSKGKVAVIMVMDDKEDQGSGISDFVGSESAERRSSILQLQNFLLNERKFAKMEKCHTSIPLIIISPTHNLQSTRELFSDNDYFSFDSKKVHFLEEEKLPVVGSSQNTHNVLLRSPWEILHSPVGSGGIFSILSSNDILENLNELGVEYVEVCSLDQRYSFAVGHPLFAGFVDFHEADVGIKVLDDSVDDCNFDMIFSMRFLKKMTKQVEPQLYAVPKLNSHVEKVDNEWIDINVTSPNSYEFHCSIYCCLNHCSPDKVCLMHVTD